MGTSGKGTWPHAPDSYAPIQVAAYETICK